MQIVITFMEQKKMSEQTTKTNKDQRKPKKIDKIVRGVCIYWIVFVSVAWIVYVIKDSVPDSLIQYGLGGGAVELIITGVIEITRDKMARKEKKNDEMDN